MFVEDARKQIEGKVTALYSAVSDKLNTYQANLTEIKKVETSATGYSEILKANINSFFDKLVQSIEARRLQLLREAELECQKDLKQIWADKTFHQTTISQISSVFDLIQKARKCTSDVEMLLTSLQGIQQLIQLSKMQWNSDAFYIVVSSPTTFTRGKNLICAKVGELERASVEGKDLEVLNPPQNPKLGSTIRFVVKGKGLVDERSGMLVNLPRFRVNKLKVVVQYGNRKRN